MHSKNNDTAEIMSDEQLFRYSRQILLPNIGIDGQRKLSSSHVCLVGVGGLGSPIAMYLAAAGVGKLTLIDSEKLDLSNLQRQILFTHEDISFSKAAIAALRLRALNPFVEVLPLTKKLSKDNSLHILAEADLVIDATDNFDARFAINEACVRLRKPLVSGAVICLEGMIGVYRLDKSEAPCYRCFYGSEAKPMAKTCSESGVLGSVVGIIGSIGSGITGSTGPGITGSTGPGMTGSTGPGITGSTGPGIIGSSSLGSGGVTCNVPTLKVTS